MSTKKLAIISLAKDILRKIKKSEVKLSNVMLQASELSHLVGLENNVKYFKDASQKVEESQIYLDAFPNLIEATKDPNVSITSANPHEMIGWSTPKGNYFERQSLITRQQFSVQTVSSYRAHTYEFVMKVYYSYLFGQDVNSILDEYKKMATTEILTKIASLKQSFQLINENIGSKNSRDWASVASECRNILIQLSAELWKSPNKIHKRHTNEMIELSGEKNMLLAYIDTKIGWNELNKSRNIKLCAIVHEVFGIGGKQKRQIDKIEVQTCVVDVYIFLFELITYTGLEPVL